MTITTKSVPFLATAHARDDWAHYLRNLTEQTDTTIIR